MNIQTASNLPESGAQTETEPVGIRVFAVGPAVVCIGISTGIGIGIDRLVTVLAGAQTLRDTIIFPFMKNSN